MQFFQSILLAIICLGLSSCGIRLADSQQWRLLNARIDTAGKIIDDPYLVSLQHENKRLLMFIKTGSENKTSYTTYIVNYDTCEKLISRIDNAADVITEIYIHGKWLPFQKWSGVSCGNSFWNMKLKSGEFIRFEIEKPKTGWIPCLYRIKSESQQDINVDDSIYSDAIFSKPKIIFLRPEDISKFGHAAQDFEYYYYNLKKPIPNNFKLMWCDKITGSTVTIEEISKNDSLIIGHVKNYNRLGSNYKIKDFVSAIVYKDTTIHPSFEWVRGNRITQSFRKKLASLHQGDLIIFGSILVESKGKVFSVPGAKYLVKT